jgi:hypothetical protein
MQPMRIFGLVTLAVIASPSIANATATLTLKKSFIEANKDRATITSRYLVDMAHNSPKTAKEDGDIHIAGWSDELGLTAVAVVSTFHAVTT